MNSCTKEPEFLDDEILVELVSDLHVAEVAIVKSGHKVTDTLQEVFLEKLEKIHGIDRRIIKQQVELLMENPQKHSEIYTKVVGRLQKLEEESKKQKLENKAKEEKAKNG